MEKSCGVSSTCLVNFDRNRYSVECDDEYQPVSVQAYSDKIMGISEGRVIAEHTRHFGRDKIIYNPLHYLRKSLGLFAMAAIPRIGIARWSQKSSGNPDEK